MKLLFLITDLRHGGAEKVLVNLVNNLNPQKYDISVQTIFDTGIHRQNIKPHVHYLPGFKWQFPGNSHLLKRIPASMLYSFMIRDNYDVIISYLEGIPARVVSGCKHPSVKKVTWIHTGFENAQMFSMGFGSFERALKAYQSFDRIVCVSEAVQARMEEVASVQFKNSMVLYNTNETDKILQLSHEKVDDVVFSHDTINICSVGKIDKNKGFDRLARIHRRLVKEGFKTHFYILGVGEQQKSIEEYLKQEGLEQTFTFLGFRDNPYKYVAACDLYVCSSYREGFSTAVTEALVVGTPVVSTECSGAHELLGKKDEYGLVVENSEEGIYVGIKKLLEDRPLLEHYASMAKRRGMFFNKENTIKAVEEMLDSL